MTEIVIDVRPVLRQLREFGVRVKKGRILKEIADRHKKWIKDNSVSGRLAGWPAFSPKTLLSREDHGSQPLGQSSIMDSMFVEIVGSTVSIGFSDPRAVFHHFGSDIPAREGQVTFRTPEKGLIMPKTVAAHKIPARRLLPTRLGSERIALAVAKAILDKAARDSDRNK